MKEYIFRKAQHEELEECTALANLAFSVDFRALLPKVYGENPPCGRHIMLRTMGN